MTNHDATEQAYKNGYEAGYNANKWISVEDKLPQKSGDYLTYNVNNEYMAVISYSEKYKIFNAFDDLSREEQLKNQMTVTHWQPLPQPPEVR